MQDKIIGSVAWLIVLAFIGVGLTGCATTHWYGGSEYYYPRMKTTSVSPLKAAYYAEECYEELGIKFKQYDGECPPYWLVKRDVIAFLKRIGAPSNYVLSGVRVTFTPHRVDCGSADEAYGCWLQSGVIVMQLGGGRGWWVDTLCHELMHEMLFRASRTDDTIDVKDNHSDPRLMETQMWVNVDEYVLAGTRWHGVFGDGGIHGE